MFAGYTTILFSSLKRHFLNYLYTDVSFGASMVDIHTVVFWTVTMCSFVDSYQLSGETCCLRNVSICLQDYTVSQFRRPQSEVLLYYTAAVFWNRHWTAGGDWCWKPILRQTPFLGQDEGTWSMTIQTTVNPPNIQRVCVCVCVCVCVGGGGWRQLHESSSFMRKTLTETEYNAKTASFRFSSCMWVFLGNTADWWVKDFRSTYCNYPLL
jgi:hypothetical protein